jgi:hypothetical protein
MAAVQPSRNVQRQVVMGLAVVLVGTAVWMLGSSPDTDRDRVADADDRCPRTPRDLAAGVDGCAAAEHALQRGVDALAATDAMKNIGTVWATRQLLRRRPDLPLHDLVVRSVVQFGRDPGAHLINAEVPPVPLPADPARGLLRFNNYVMAAFGAPRDRAVSFITEFLRTDEHGYTLTHQLLALLWAEDLGFELPPELRAQRRPLLARLEAEQRSSPARFSDLYAERVALLLAFGSPPRAEAARWIDVIVAAQQPDGRWVDSAKSSVSYDGQTGAAFHEWTHTSGLSVIALASFLTDGV